MADKGIIFSAPMVRALLDGRKTQTRRLLKPQPVQHVPDLAFTWGKFSGLWPDDWFGHGNEIDDALPYAPGDRLYVREACRAGERADGWDYVEYLADEAQVGIGELINAPARWSEMFYYGGKRPSGTVGKSVPSIHMPRWASRLTLLVTDVRVQRVAEIGSADAEAEGVERHGVARGWKNYRDHRLWCAAPETSFESLWNSLHDKPGERWPDNPWVVVVTFDVVRENIDKIGDPA